MPRSRLTPLLCLVVIFLVGCSEPATSPVVDRGSFLGQWDSAEWHGHAYAVLQKDTLFIVAHRPDPTYHYDEYILAKVHYAGVGSYTVPESAGQLMKMTGGDAGYFPKASGTLTVQELSSQARRVTGELSLTADHFGTLWTSEGEFKARLLSSLTDIPWDQRSRR